MTGRCDARSKTGDMRGLAVSYFEASQAVDYVSFFRTSELTIQTLHARMHCRRAFKSDQLCALNFDQGR